MITPRQITASNFPDSAAFCAHNGISKAPGTRNRWTAFVSESTFVSAAWAPSIKRETMSSFQRLATIAKRNPLALRLLSAGCDFCDGNFVMVTQVPTSASLRIVSSSEVVIAARSENAIRVTYDDA